MENKFELLAPGGDLESIKAAIVAGADAIYCGLDRFNARNRAENLTLDNLNDVIDIAHQHDCKIFVTLNVIILENEIPAIMRLLMQLSETNVDGVIIQDLGLAYLLKAHFPALDVHASTQLNTHNEGQILFMKQLGVSRVNLSRELNITEITRLAQFGLKHDVLMEVFVHGSYCIGFSGLCYISSVRNGASGNRGRCSQPCRDQYHTTKVGSDYPLNMKDNSAFSDLPALAEAGVYSLKIEGRIKKAHYVYSVVDNWRKQIDAYCNDQPLKTDRTDLYTVFNRDFSNGYLKGDISKDMFINNPRDNSAAYFAAKQGVDSPIEIKRIKQQLFDTKTDIIKLVEQKSASLAIRAKSAQVKSLKGGGNLVPQLEPAPSLALQQPRLSVLVSSPEDVEAIANRCATSDTLAFENIDLYYQLPSALHANQKELTEYFRHHPNIIPYFPAILIDKDFDAAAELLDAIRPSKIVSNNTGVGYLAAQKQIKWIAGPQLNITNSFALKCLKEEFQCSGAFISNEISRIQMRRIVRPNDFELIYSIYHPMILLTSRQCLFQQSVGCKKERVNKGCLPRCEKNASIINLNDSPYIIDKKRGSHNSLYAQHHHFNPDVITDLPDLYTGFMVDVTTISTMTHVTADKGTLVDMFNGLIQGKEEVNQKLEQAIQNTTNHQYVKGL